MLVAIPNTNSVGPERLPKAVGIAFTISMTSPTDRTDSQAPEASASPPSCSRRA
jgi:hypothetical protein